MSEREQSVEFECVWESCIESPTYMVEGRFKRRYVNDFIDPAPIWKGSLVIIGMHLLGRLVKREDVEAWPPSLVLRELRKRLGKPE